MREFTSHSEWQHPKLGKCFVVLCPDDIWNPAQLLDEDVLINDQQYNVADVEFKAVNCSPTMPYTGYISLVVKP